MTSRIVRQRCVVLTFPAACSLTDLLHGIPQERVFTARERQAGLRGPAPGTWAGRLAAKAAVLAVLGLPAPADPVPPSGELPWAAVEILPDSQGLCAVPGACERSHRPAVTLHGQAAALLGTGERVAVSISHSAATAVALAARITGAVTPSPSDTGPSNTGPSDTGPVDPGAIRRWPRKGGG
jgi:phosphopantetheinyl transferase (holo-ACP synthase)